ncbi:hypothetical protein [Kitasatospora kifunensis]|uniref:Putative lipoprotein with Yx(FWY)xxD motif n=1 Tax=Kitasatospora kifunensis TaxID=58351 RepID=A0A7W7VTT4_KITKI|nr:hypothetical protein [Kitasatospora kifunensis]MBB4922587.1 putative lipoprotein with Yx(FWY)xxD motif [Kitasatospora kifunensis]
MPNLRRVGALTAVGVAVLAFATACGSTVASTGTASPGTSATGTVQAPAATAPATPPPGMPAGAAVKVTTVSGLGQIVTDSNGFTLYRFAHDGTHPSTVTCTGSCAAQWPGAVAPSRLTGDGVSASLIGTVTGAGGARQLTLNGAPLYRYLSDTKPGEAKGEGVGGTWWAVTPTGIEVKPATPTNANAPNTPSNGVTNNTGNGY